MCKRESRELGRVSWGKHVSHFPISDGNFSRSLRHSPTVVDRSVGSCASVSRGKHVSKLPIGAMGKVQVSAARTSCCGPERRPQLCKSESRQVCQPFSHRGVGNFSRPLRHVQSVVDRRVRSCASVIQASTSAMFASGRSELFKVSQARTTCIEDRSICSCASEKASTSAIFPWGRWEL